MLRTIAAITLIISCVSTETVLLAMHTCDPNANNLIIWNGTVVNGEMRDHLINITVPITDQPGGFEIAILKSDGTFATVANIPVRNTCQALNKYLGELLVDLQRAAHLMNPGCPIAKGVYKIKRFKPDWTRLRMQGYPKGQLKVFMRLYDKSSKAEVACVLMQVLSK